MRAYDLIIKKRDGNQLTKAEIQFLVHAYTAGTVQDYQMAAWCMAVYFQGMTIDEIAALTMAMAHSGDVFDLGGIQGKKIDKHSTGGVGDTTTLVVAPLVASCGIPVAKMSGKGLGHTGGTIDKLASIPGFRTELTQTEFLDQVRTIQIALVGQTGTLAPADKKLYALRDVTATVDSIPLIASSIMSKKIAAGADGFILDVKTGSGAFMKEIPKAIELAKIMVAIGKSVDKPTVALVTNMDQPLGTMIGNSLEMQEAITILNGQTQCDLTQLSLLLAAEMLILAGHVPNFAQAEREISHKLKNKAGLGKLKEMIQSQGGDCRVVDDPSLLPQAPYRTAVIAAQSGYIQHINSHGLGLVAMQLGAGREHKDSIIDLAVGLELKKKVSDYVQTGETLAVIHSSKQLTAHQSSQVATNYQLTPTKPNSAPLVYEKISFNDV